MRIGLFTDTYWPQVNGVATSVLMLKENLTSQGHDVFVFTTTDPMAPADEENVFRVKSVPFVSMRRLGSIYNPKLKKLIESLDLDVIHTNTEFSLGVFGRGIARHMDIPHVHTMHTVYEDYTHFIIKLGRFDVFAKAAARKMSCRFCNSADEVITPTEKVRQMMKTYGVYKPMTVVPTGVDLKRFSKDYSLEQKNQVKEKFGISPSDKVILYIGRVSEEKNIEEILNAMKVYLPQHADTKLLIVGDGPHKSELVQMAAELGINDQVVFTGEQPWDDIGLFYSLGDVFVNASQSEAQGLTYIEALASGLPVIAKYDHCLDGVIEQGKNGFTFNEQDEFLEFIDQIMDNPEKLKKMAECAKESSEEFSAVNFASSLAAVYKSIIPRKVIAG